MGQFFILESQNSIPKFRGEHRTSILYPVKITQM